jgi:outer membrane protein assembly factor BamA
MKQLDKEMLSEADIVIEPNIENSSATNFTNIDSLILKGYKSALLHISTIKAKIGSFTSGQIKFKSFYIRNIVCDKDTSQLINSFYNKYSSVDSVSNSTILLDLLTLFKTGLFEDIKANIIQTKDSTNLKFVYVPAEIIKSVSVVSGNGIEKSKIDSILNYCVGQVYKPREIVNSIIEVLKHYRKNGYLLARCSDVEFDKNTGHLKVFFNDGIISKVIIDAYTSKTVIEREFPVKAGDYFSYDVVKAGLTSLRSTGLFNDINLSVTETEEGNILKLSLRERVSSLLKVGFLVNDFYKAQLGLDLREVNLFGDGTEIGLFLFGGASNRAYILEHIAHRVFNTYLTYKINAYYKFNDIGVYERTSSATERTFTSTKTGEYRQIFYGASLSLGTQIEKFGKLIFIGKYQIDRVKNIEGRQVEPYETKIVSLKIGVTIDSRNKYPYPDDGVYFDGYYETAQSFLGGDEGFILVGMDFGHLFKISKSHVMASRIHIGFGDKTLPLSEQFTLGGQYSFFGAHEFEFRGRQIALASLKYQFKIPFKIFFDTYLWFRYDLGATWRTQELIRFKDLKHGIGGTVSFDTPIGPVDFSIGRSFLLRKDLPDNPLSWGDILFYFSIGHAITF